jgi:hypothetical protein
MMDAATLQSRIYAGYAKAAARVGYSADPYGGAGATTPIAAGNKLRSLPASFNAEDMGYGKPNKYGKATWFGLFDGSLTQPGDYMVSAQDSMFFIAAQQTALPILLVSCNRTINVLRPQQQTGLGAVGYGGNVDATETSLMTAWPASVLQGSKGEKGGAALPGDVRDPWWTVLLPNWPGVTLRSGDIITDDLVRRYVVSSAELTDLGWRLTAMQVQT